MEISENISGASAESNTIPVAKRSLEGSDSNAVMLPAKKNKKWRRKDQVQVETAVKKKQKPRLSKSQKRKLKKLEEEKEKAVLLSKSIETLTKYRIPDDAYSLLQSSKSIGRDETKLEKRQRVVQFSKMGLEVPQNDKSSEGRDNYNSSSENEDASDETKSRKDIKLVQPVIIERETMNNASDSFHFSQFEPSIVSAKALAAESVSGKDIGTAEQVGNQKFRPTFSVPDGNKGFVFSTMPTAPTVVHVSRPDEVENKRKDLPIVMMEQEIMEAIYDNLSVIICGETGCGKTTQVPQFLYEAGFGSDKSMVRSGIIGVTQPRRIAVLATAKRVAFELGLHLGKEVGFQVRHDKKIGHGCSIKFMTDGILLREVQSDILLKRYSIIILDEVHERSLNTDILIGMLSRVIQLRKDLYEKQQAMVLSGKNISRENMIFPLKLVLMSATLRVEDFTSESRLFREPPPVIEVPTRQFPVTAHFSKRTEIVDYIGQAFKKVMSIHKRLPPGGILVFVTGQREVEYLCRKLVNASRELVSRTSKINGTEAIPGSEMNSVEETIMKDISEAFEIQGKSTNQQTDRFSSYDEDQWDFDEDESDVSFDSETESELEFVSKDGDTSKQEKSENVGNLIDVLGEDGSLASLKAAFEALARGDTLHSNPEEKEPESKGIEKKTSNADDSIEETNPSNEGGDKNLLVGALRVLPLYAMLPAAAQLRVFEDVKEGERLVVVATNVAETSLTIPGIKYVVDTGREKVKNYKPNSGMETYEVQWISKASAAQRAGRAGRTGPGHCYRLYSSAVFSNILPDFSCAEISKIPVDGVVLLMKSMGIDKVSNFPFPTAPNATALVEAERCLMALEALDISGRLTPLGKAMACYPMSPRHSRMLLTVIQIMRKVKSYTRANLVLGYAVAAAAALSLSNPIVMRFEGSQNVANYPKEAGSVFEDNKTFFHKEEKLRKKELKEKAKALRAKFSNHTSDALTVAFALQCFELSKNQCEFCNENGLHLKTMEEMSKLRKQLLHLVFNQNADDDIKQDFSWTHGTIEDVELSWRVSSSKNPLLRNEEEFLGQAICAGWADRVAKRVKAVSTLSEGDRKVNATKYQSCMVKETLFLHRWSSLSNAAPEFLVYSELLHTKRPYIHGATSVKSEWLVEYAGSLCSFSAPLTDPKPYYKPQTDKVYCWVNPTFGPHLWQLPLHSLLIKSQSQRVAVFAFALLDGQVLPCLRSVKKYMAVPPDTILKPESYGQRRVGNLLHKLKTQSIDSCDMLRKTWEQNPSSLCAEIRDWFQERFHGQFEGLWLKMLSEVLLEPHERFPKRVKKDRMKR